jgi:hypothetical protein
METNESAQTTSAGYNLDKPDFTNNELAAILGCAPYTVRRSRTTGILLGKKAPRYKNRGRKIAYPREEVVAFDGQFELQENTAQNRADDSLVELAE